MAEKYENVEKIEETRNRISRLTELISQEASPITLIKENPVLGVLILLVVGIFGAILSKNIFKLLFSLIKFSIKFGAFVYFVKRGLSFLPNFKKLRR